MCYWFFFFQAKDGIRDYKVTGVQTCALPICSSVPPPGSGRERSNTPTLSRPRKPPPKRWFPSLSLRFTHQVKLRQSFWKRRERKSRSRPPRGPVIDRKSTRLNSSHLVISYA